MPQIVVEVVSPADRAETILERTAEYFRAGTRLVWIVYPSHDQVYVYDARTRVRILQEKVGNYGEGIFTKEYPNPLKKTRYFLHRLKDYLSTRDTRFQRLHIIPVVGFAELE